MRTMTKKKGPSNCKKAEWEKLLMANQIYMGDHMTRTWSKNEKVSTPEVQRPQGRRQKAAARKSHSLESNAGPQPCHSQYSVRKVPNGRRKLKSGKEVLMHHHITKADFEQWQESFDSLLNSPAGRYVFKLFLESEIADENLKFWLACEDLKHTKQKRLEKRIQDIYDTYINVYSPNEINIGYKLREEIVDQLKEKMDVSVFTEAQHQVYTLMHRDSYPRFLSSPFTAELMKAFAETEEKSPRKPAEVSPSKSTSSSHSMMSYCCCRRQSSELDSSKLVEDQPTATTPVTSRTANPPEQNNALSSPSAAKDSKSSTMMSTAVNNHAPTSAKEGNKEEEHRSLNIVPSLLDSKELKQNSVSELKESNQISSDELSASPDYIPPMVSDTDTNKNSNDAQENHPKVQEELQDTETNQENSEEVNLPGTLK